MFIPMATPEEEPYQLVPSDWQGCVVKQPVLEGIWTFLFFLMPCAFQSVKQKQGKEPVPCCWCFVPVTYGEGEG